MNSEKLKAAQERIAAIIVDHFEFCSDQQSSATTAAAEILTTMLAGQFGSLSSNTDAGLERLSERLGCDAKFAACVVAVDELKAENERQRRMIGKLRQRDDSQKYVALLIDQRVYGPFGSWDESYEYGRKMQMPFSVEELNNVHPDLVKASDGDADPVSRNA